MSDYYLFPNGAEVIDISRYLTGNGAQAVQYIARATRIDGKNKGDIIGDLNKAIYMISDEIGRIEDQSYDDEIQDILEEKIGE